MYQHRNFINNICPLYTTTLKPPQYQLTIKHNHCEDSIDINLYPKQDTC